MRLFNCSSKSGKRKKMTASTLMSNLNLQIQILTGSIKKTLKLRMKQKFKRLLRRLILLKMPTKMIWGKMSLLKMRRRLLPELSSLKSSPKDSGPQIPQGNTPIRLTKKQVALMLDKLQELLKLQISLNQRVHLEALVQVVLKKKTKKSFLHSLL